MQFLKGSAFSWIRFLSPRVVSPGGMEDDMMMIMRGERTTHTYTDKHTHARGGTRTRDPSVRDRYDTTGLAISTIRTGAIYIIIIYNILLV